MPASRRRRARRPGLWEYRPSPQGYRRYRTSALRPWVREEDLTCQPAWRPRHLLRWRQSAQRYVQLSYAHSHHDMAATEPRKIAATPMRRSQRISPAKGQGMVKERYLNRVNTILLCYRFALRAFTSASIRSSDKQEEPRPRVQFHTARRRRFHADV